MLPWRNACSSAGSQWDCSRLHRTFARISAGLVVLGYGGWFFNSRWVETLGGACAAAAPRLTMRRATNEMANAVTSDFAALVGMDAPEIGTAEQGQITTRSRFRPLRIEQRLDVGERPEHRGGLAQDDGPAPSGTPALVSHEDDKRPGASQGDRRTAMSNTV